MSGQENTKIDWNVLWFSENQSASGGDADSTREAALGDPTGHAVTCWASAREHELSLIRTSASYKKLWIQAMETEKLNQRITSIRRHLEVPLTRWSIHRSGGSCSSHHACAFLSSTDPHRALCVCRKEWTNSKHSGKKITTLRKHEGSQQWSEERVSGL